MTSDKEFARAWAATWANRHGRAGDGSLYLVRPHDELLEDPDYPGFGVSWWTAAATIVSVDEAKVRMTPREANRRALKYATWTDGTPRYDDEGYSTVAPDAHPLVTKEMFRQLEPWTDIDSIDAQKILNKLIERAAQSSR